MIKSVLLIYNPNAGSSPDINTVNQVYEKLMEFGISTETHITSADALFANLLIRLEKSRPDLVICMGGDGTANFAASALIGSSIPLLLIPTGSSNGLAADLNIPMDGDSAMNLIYTGKIQQTDCIEIDHQYYSFHLSDYGFNANLVDRYHESDRRGLFDYFKFLFRELFYRQDFNFRFSADGVQYYKEASMLAIANARIYGTGAALNPQGLINDGLFEICIIKPFPFSAILSLTWDAFNHQLNESPYFESYRCKEAIVENLDGANFQADGELFTIPDVCDFKCIHNAINVLAPAF